MSARDCIRNKAKLGRVNGAKGDAAFRRITEIRKALLDAGESPTLAENMAALQYADELKLKNARSKWRMINRVRVMRELEAEVGGMAAKSLGSAAMKMVDDLDFEARALHRMTMGRLGALLEKHRPTLAGNVRKPMEFMDFLRALGGESAANPEAAAFARAVNDTNEWMRQTLNSYGYSIGKLEGWGLPHTHSPTAISTDGFAKWAPALDAKLDWAGMIDPRSGLEFGHVPDPKTRNDFLEGAYENIIYGRNSKNPAWGESAAGNILERHRVFKFKSVDDWVEYNKAYGSTDPHSALMQHFDSMSRHMALARKFGPNAETAMDYLQQLVANRARTEKLGMMDALKAESGAKWAKGMVRVMEGGIGPNGWAGAQSARFFATTRKVLSAALLDRAIVISVPSDLNSARLAARAVGMNETNFMSTYTGLLQDAVTGGGMTRQDLLRAQHIADSWANPSVTSSRFQEEYPSAAWADKMANAAMRVQGMNAHTDSAKLAWAWSLSGHMASEKDKALDALDEPLRKAMRESGITASDWDNFRNSGGIFTASNGAEFLSPLYWREATSHGRADELALKFQSFVERWTERAVPTRSLMAQGILDPKAYGLAPGSIPYEIMKSGTMFKSFPAAFVVNQVRMLSHATLWSRGPFKGRFAYAGELLLSATMAGALAMQVNEMLMGRKPQPMDGHDFWLRAILKGGGLGPVGDILATGTSSWGGGIPSYIAGPVPQLAQDAASLTLGNLAVAFNQAMDGDEIDMNFMNDLMKFQKRYTPLQQSPIWLGGAAIDRLFSDQLQMLLDPDSVNSLAKAETTRQNRYGNASFWAPGQIAPGVNSPLQ
jgi:hypothetical protein